MKKRAAVIIMILLAAAAVTALILHDRRAGSPPPEMPEETLAESVKLEQDGAAEQMGEDSPVVISVPDDESPAEETESPSVTTETETPEMPTVVIDPGTEDPGEESEDPEEEPEQTPTPTTTEAWTAWDSFLALSPQAQDEFMKSFDSVEAFTEWMLAAQREWAAVHQPEEIPPDGSITIGN